MKNDQFSGLVVIVALLGLLAIGNSIVLAGPPTQCTTIKDGTLTDTLGNPLVLGFDQFGYNYRSPENDLEFFPAQKPYFQRARNSKSKWQHLYQAHEFNGTYDSVDRVLDGKYWGQTADFVDDHLWMKWSDDWLSNKDCNGDGKLDRGAPGSSGYPIISIC